MKGLLSSNIRSRGLSVKRSRAKGAILFGALLVFFAAALLMFARPYIRRAVYDYRDAKRKSELPEAVTREDVPTSVGSNVISNEVEKFQPVATTTPALSPPRNDSDNITSTKPSVTAINLKIPFVSQAPHRNWDMPYQEACEEASAIMASLYYQGDTREMVIGDAGDALLKKVIAWEEEQFGYYQDTTVAETVVMLEEYFKLRARIVDDPMVKDIKEAVAAGHPVIMPAYGKVLPNPYFKNGGPLYHMLIVKGYTETKFITNDPGTNTRGADFTYTIDALMNAIHDWNGGDVPQGAKRIIIVEGPQV